MAASRFDPSSLRPLPPTMATLPRPPSLVLPKNSYWDHFSRAETDTFHGRYAVLAPYSMDPVDTFNAYAPANATQLIYATA